MLRPAAPRSTTGDVPEPVAKFDACLRVLKNELRPLAHWTPVHVHLGAAEVTGRIAILEGTSIAPGAEALVQIVLDRPLGALYGDGLIIRDQSAQRTIGGGRVIDIFPPIRGRSKPERLAFLAAMDNHDPAKAFTTLLPAAPRGLDLVRFSQNRNLTEEEAATLFTGASTRCVATPSGMLGFSAENWKRLKTTLVEALTSLHRHNPAAIPSEERVLLEAGLRLPKEVATALAAELTKEGTIVRGASGIRLGTHVAQLSPADAALWKKTQPLLNENVLRPPSVHEIANAFGMDAQKTAAFLVRAASLGFLVRVAENRFFLPAGLRSHAQFAEEIAAANKGSVTGGALRDRTGIGRTLAIEILEYFDRIKFTRRTGNEHHVLRPAREAFGDG